MFKSVCPTCSFLLGTFVQYCSITSQSWKISLTSSCYNLCHINTTGSINAFLKRLASSACRIEVCEVWFFLLLLRSCVSKIESCSWYDSWVQKNYRLLLLLNSCYRSRRMQININISKALGWKITPAPSPGPVLIENIHSWSCSGSCWKTLTPDGVDSCTPAPAHLCCRTSRCAASKWHQCCH